jgi:hydrogenase/urease accessory protein HupE
VGALYYRALRHCRIAWRAWRPAGSQASSPIVLLLLVIAAMASAHTGGSTGFASLTVRENSIRYRVGLYPKTLPAAITEVLLAAQTGDEDARERLFSLYRERLTIVADGTRCAAGQAQILPPDAEPDRVMVVVDFACAGHIHQLALRDDTFDVLGADHHTLVRIDAGGEVHQLALEPTNREGRVTITTQGAASRGGTSFFLLGMHHILSGWDHLLFLLALLLRGGTILTLLKIVTAFTVAHSVTLALAIFDVVTLPSRLVESVIALSIAFVAAENLFPRRAFSARWAVSFCFGLVHGFGFSAALRELGLPSSGQATSLLAFNLGVEAGQAMVIAAVMPLLLLLFRRARWASLLTRACSLTILVIGLALSVERIFVP